MDHAPPGVPATRCASAKAGRKRPASASSWRCVASMPEAFELSGPSWERATGRIMGYVMTKQEMIEEITRRLVEFYRPVRIYLFGSEARGEAGPDSDFDFCVVLPDEAPESLYKAKGVHRNLWGLRAAVDVVRLPFGDFEFRARHVLSSLPATVVREGKILYESERSPA